jgi:N-acetylglutamate synthase-like GNAT family acetyltransferase
MAEPGPDDMLREAARARGFRLVKSRRRKPGGDFGLYGLTDLNSGRECLGFGADGLTATADEVHAYLRGGEVASWKRSLIGAVADTPKEAAAPAAKKAAAAPAPPPPAPKRAKPVERKEAPEALPLPPEVQPAKPEQSLAIREATRRDAAAMAKLLKLDAASLAERLAAAIRQEEPPLIAEREGLVGVCAWTIVPTLQHGARGRITLIVVAESERRRGTGAALLAQAEQRLSEAGIGAIEMLLDIDLEAPTGFLRRTGWERTTNGYGKALES